MVDKQCNRRLEDGKMIQNFNEQQAGVSARDENVLRGVIAEWDRNGVHLLAGNSGITIASSDEIYQSLFPPDPAEKAKEEAKKRWQDEVQRLIALVAEWLDKYENSIDRGRTRFLPKPLYSSSGKVRYQLIVIPQEGQEASMEKALADLDSLFVGNDAFQIVRLDSVLL